MAFIEITSANGDIDVNFGVYGDGVKQPFKSNFKKSQFGRVDLMTDHVRVVLDGAAVYLVYEATENYFIVDKVGTDTTFSSMEDFYNKLKALR